MAGVALPQAPRVPQAPQAPRAGQGQNHEAPGWLMGTTAKAVVSAVAPVVASPAECSSPLAATARTEPSTVAGASVEPSASITTTSIPDVTNRRASRTSSRSTSNAIPACEKDIAQSSPSAVPLEAPLQAAMNPLNTADPLAVRAEPALDPISRQILERTQSHTRIPQASQSGVPHGEPGPSDEPNSARHSSDPAALRRTDSAASSKLSKDKKKGVSFLSRIMGGNKKRDSFDLRDAASEVSENRSEGLNAEVFSQPVGFIPKFPAPPRYIKVKTQYRKQKDFDRLFLAQVALDSRPVKSRKTSIDSKIHDITDTPAVDPASKPASTNNAVWAMEFSKDGKYMAAAGQDKKLRVWEVISSAEEREAEDALSETNNEGQNVKLNAPLFKTKPIREYEGHTSSILDLSWSKNNFLLSSSMDKTVRLYHISRAECLCAFKHTDFVTSIQFHPRDDRFFLAGSLDSRLRLWSIPDKNVAYSAQVPDMVTAVAFTPDGRTAIAGCLGGLCILYDTEGLKAHSQIHVRSARGKNARGSKITGIDTISIPKAAGPPHVKVLITSNDSRVRMYNLKDRTLEVKFRGNENSCSQIHASFSDDGKYVICGSEDRKVYIWPTAVNERPENDKRPMEVFEAHSAIVTNAIFAPESTRRHLAQSGDPIYDLCNPPPVTLVSRADSVISSRAPTNNSTQSEDKRAASEVRISESPKRAPETPAYQARQSHPGGLIIVTADYTGIVKVFRQDCAFQKRRHESWEGNSTFSKKVLARSASVATRNSTTSSTNRHSLILGSKNQSTDRINNWRNSIATTNSTGTPTSNSLLEIRGSLQNHDRSRSTSPRKSLVHRLSLRHASSPPSAPTVPESHSPLQQIQNGPTIQVQSPLAESPGSFHSALQAKSPERERQTSGSTLNPDKSNAESGRPGFPHSPGDPLFLVDNESYLAWDVKNTLVPMARHPPRTPGLLGPDGNPLSRANSYVSQLSSEVTSSERDPNSGNVSGEEDQAGGLRAKPGRAKGSRWRRKDSTGSEDDLRCAKCRNKTFKAQKGDGGVQRLICKKCGTVLP